MAVPKIISVDETVGGDLYVVAEFRRARGQRPFHTEDFVIDSPTTKETFARRLPAKCTSTATTTNSTLVTGFGCRSKTKSAHGGFVLFAREKQSQTKP